MTIVWAFPPGRAGWMGLTDLNMGFDKWSADRHPSVQTILGKYLATVATSPGAQPVKAKNLEGTVYHFSPLDAKQNFSPLTEAVASLVNEMNTTA